MVFNDLVTKVNSFVNSIPCSQKSHHVNNFKGRAHRPNLLLGVVSKSYLKTWGRDVLLILWLSLEK